MIGIDDVTLDPLRTAAADAVVGVSVDGSRRVVSVGATSASTPFRVASLSKTVTAVATVRAAGEAGVDLCVPVLTLLPDLRAHWAADPRVTVADLLSQTSGLAPTVTAEEVARLGDGDRALAETARLVVRAGSARPPGERWEYYNGNYFLAGAIVEALTGTTFEQAVEGLVLRPWHLESTSFAPPADLVPGVDGGGVVPMVAYPRGRRPSGGLCGTGADLLTFGEALSADEDLVSLMAQPRTRPEDPVRYGLGWAVGPSGQMYVNGRLPGYRSAMVLVPERRLVAVVLAADSDGLPAAAAILSDLQRGYTGDDLADLIVSFAA